MNNIFVSKRPITQLPLQFSPQIFLSHFPSFSRKNQNFLIFAPKYYSSCRLKTQTLCIATPPGSLGYGGWDDFELGSESVLSGESTQLQKFLKSLGINDKKYIIVYLLGFICALVVSRIRVSSIIAIPASVIVFAVGYSLGYVNGGHLSFNGSKKRPKDEIFRGSLETLRCLIDMLNMVDCKIMNLKDGIKKNIENSNITLADLEDFVRIAESIDSSASDAKTVIKCLIESIVIENQDVEESLSKKTTNRRKEVGENGFSLSRFISGLFTERSADRNDGKTKDYGKRELKDIERDHGKRTNILAPVIDEQIQSTKRDGSLSRNNADGPTITRENTKNVIADSRINVGAESWNISMAEMDSVSEKVFGRKEYHYKNERVHYINNQQISLNASYTNRVEKRESRDGYLGSKDFDVDSLKDTETEASFRQEQRIRDLRREYIAFDDNFREAETLKSPSQGSEGSIQDEDSSQVDQESGHDTGSGSSASIFSDDKEFNRFVAEANILLKQAKRIMSLHGNDGHAENALYDSARLLSKAIGIRPMSLLAVGELGNTYLLHGELKLRISRELRATLARNNPVSMDKWGLNASDDTIARKDEAKSALVNTCEECEELLIKAGRNYRLALSIDGNDMKALYNWGLALSFRGQLIADIGPGAARDADEVFMAAIDKFDAMLSKSNSCAPDALFKWGAALQQRSRLRPRNSKEKVKLLQQARRLYEDALDMDSNNFEVQEALSTCISELNYWYK